MRVLGWAILTTAILALAGCETTKDFSSDVRQSVGGLFTRDSGVTATNTVARPQAAAAAAPTQSVGGPPFSSAADVAYAAVIWDAMNNDYFVGRDSIATYPYEGNQPHGEFLEIVTSYARISGHEGMLIIKKNYLGDGITREDVATSPDEYIDSVTIMFQREAGYDSDNLDWFWAKYAPDGTVMTNPAGMQLAGRVAKGANQGCIACHVAAPGGDFVFSHDRLFDGNVAAN